MPGADLAIFLFFLVFAAKPPKVPALKHHTSSPRTLLQIYHVLEQSATVQGGGLDCIYSTIHYCRSWFGIVCIVPKT